MLDVPGLVTGRRRRVGPDLRRDRGRERRLLDLVDRGCSSPLAAVAAVLFVLVERQTGDPVRPPRVLPDPGLLERERRRLRHELRPLRRVLLHRAVPPDRGEVLGRRRSRSSSSRWPSRWSSPGQVAGRWTAARGPRGPMAARLPARGRRDVRGRLAALPERRPVGALGRARSRRVRARPRAVGGDGVGARDRAGASGRAWRPRP